MKKDRKQLESGARQTSDPFSPVKVNVAIYKMQKFQKKLRKEKRKKGKNCKI